MLSVSVCWGPACPAIPLRGFPLRLLLSVHSCSYLCTGMFANRPDKTAAVRQTQNTNINTQTNPFTHRVRTQTISKHSLSPLSDAIVCQQQHCLVHAQCVSAKPCLIINRRCQRVGALSVWQGISINTDFLSISVCTTLLTFNYGCLNVCYLPTQVCVRVCVCGQQKAFSIVLFKMLYLKILNRDLTRLVHNVIAWNTILPGKRKIL